MDTVKRRIRRFLGVPEPETGIERNSNATYMGGVEVLTVLYNTQKLYVDTRDTSETPNLIADGFWERPISEVFERLVSEGSTVFDIGSTYGYYAAIAGSQGAGNILVVDANPVYEPYLQKNMAVNGLLEKATIEMVAVGDAKGTIELHVLKDDWNSTTTQDLKAFEKNRSIPFEVDETIEVPMTTLDALAKKHRITEVDVLKIDIEGQEEASYDGMQDIIKNSPNLALLTEFSSENYDKPKQFFGRFQKDFDHIYVMPNGNNLQRVGSFDELQDIVGDGWMMILAAKQDLDEQLADCLPQENS